MECVVCLSSSVATMLRLGHRQRGEGLSVGIVRIRSSDGGFPVLTFLMSCPLLLVLSFTHD